MLEKEFQYYLDNQSKFVDLYLNKSIVIVGDKVEGSFNSHGEAFEYASKHFKKGTFLIQLVTPGEEAYSHTFHSRVVINSAV